VIKQLSPVIRGWCNYYRYAVAKRTFANLDHHIWRITYKCVAAGVIFPRSAV
jgi:RNA-directed DNA polymerase